MTVPVRIAALCGSTSTPSSTEHFLRIAAAHAEALGAQVDFHSGERLRLPLYGTRPASLDGPARVLITSLAAADGVLLASPCYHGSVSGLLKNALDYLEELRDSPFPYLDGRAVGCVAVGQGTQGPVNTLRAMRDIVHALRGWPTPLGVTVNSSAVRTLGDPDIEACLERVTRQVVSFAQSRRTLLAVPVAARPA